MLVTRQSAYSGVVKTLDLNITDEEMNKWNSDNPPHIQNCFPNLTPAEREFILTGITGDEWDAMFPPEEEDEDLDEMEDKIKDLFKSFDDDENS